MRRNFHVKAAILGFGLVIVAAPSAAYANLKDFDLTITQNDLLKWRRVADSSRDWHMEADSGWTLSDITGCKAGFYGFRLMRNRPWQPDQQIFKREGISYCAIQQQIYSSWGEADFHFDKTSNAVNTPTGYGFISQSW